MPRSVVTGAAGFIGSHLSEGLIARGHEVLGIDCLTPYYDQSLKWANLERLRALPGFTFARADLTADPLEPLLEDADYVFHQAGQPGVRGSWGQNFTEYTTNNLVATQRLLEALKGHPLQKLVYASSSSVYGNAPLPMREGALPQPVSPYGVTKLAAEHLCLLYHANYGVPAVALRYFTVYGPRQRPDMAFNRFIRAIAAGEPISIHGDGLQSRDFTYVGDIVRANVLAASNDAVGAAINIGGGCRITLRELLPLIGRIVGRTPEIVHDCEQKGDVGHTAADSSVARRLLGFVPQVALPAGLERQVAWQLEARHLARAS